MDKSGLNNFSALDKLQIQGGIIHFEILVLKLGYQVLPRQVSEGVAIATSDRVAAFKNLHSEG